MVEINFTNADAALLDPLVLRFQRLFDRPTVSYDAARKQLRLGSQPSRSSTRSRAGSTKAASHLRRSRSAIFPTHSWRVVLGLQ